MGRVHGVLRRRPRHRTDREHPGVRAARFWLLSHAVLAGTVLGTLFLVMWMRLGPESGPRVSRDGRLGIGGGSSAFEVTPKLLLCEALLFVVLATGLLGRRGLERAGRGRVAVLTALLCTWPVLLLLLDPSSYPLAAGCVGVAVVWGIKLDHALREEVPDRPRPGDRVPRPPHELVARGVAVAFGLIALAEVIRSMVLPAGSSVGRSSLLAGAALVLACANAWLARKGAQVPGRVSLGKLVQAASILLLFIAQTSGVTNASNGALGPAYLWLGICLTGMGLGSRLVFNGLHGERALLTRPTA